VAKDVPLVSQEVLPSDNAAVVAKPSMMSRFKQQLEQTGGFFKKQQHAFIDKVSKGLNQKGLHFFGGKTSGEKNDAPEQAFQATPLCADENDAILAAKDSCLDTDWAARLEQMGFDRASVVEAVQILGGQPRDMDELLQVLAVMSTRKEHADIEMCGTSSNAPNVEADDEICAAYSNASDASSKSTTEGPVKLSMDVDHQSNCVAKNIEVNADIDTRESGDMLTHTDTNGLAAAVVASVVLKVLGKLGQSTITVQNVTTHELAAAVITCAVAETVVAAEPDGETRARKQFGEDHISHSSPVVGGA
jgi:hypothetical protein